MERSTPLHIRAHLLRAAVTHAHELTRFLKSQVSDATDGEDLMQEVYLSILKLRAPQHIRSPKAYLFTIAANLAHGHRLRRKEAPLHIALEETTPEALHRALPGLEANAPESDAVLAERLEDLDHRLSELSPKVRAAILLSHRDGYTYEEIAEKLSVVRNRVKKYLIKGLAHCRSEPVQRMSPTT